MQARAAAIAAGKQPELVWLLEHPALYTAGTSAKPEELIEARFPVFESGRGGQMTYHGPGQRVAYVMLDLKRRRPDVRRFVATLEEWIIRTLAAFNVRGERREDRIGVWVRRPEKGEGCEDKIAAIGIRVTQWVTLHGMAFNVEPDLVAFCRHRALRGERATLRRHQSGRPRHSGVDGGSGHGAGPRIRRIIRRDGSRRRQHRKQFARPAGFKVVVGALRADAARRRGRRAARPGRLPPCRRPCLPRPRTPPRRYRHGGCAPSLQGRA